MATSNPVAEEEAVHRIDAIFTDFFATQYEEVPIRLSVKRVVSFLKTIALASYAARVHAGKAGRRLKTARSMCENLAFSAYLIEHLAASAGVKSIRTVNLLNHAKGRDSKLRRRVKELQRNVNEVVPGYLRVV